MAVEPHLIAAVKQQIEGVRNQCTDENIAACRANVSASTASNANDAVEHQFNLGQLLAFSRNRKLRSEGVAILRDVDVRGTLGSTAQLWLALAYLEDGQFKAARALLQKVALEEPTNRLAEGSLGLYRERVEGEGPAGLKQLALVVGASILVVGLGAWWLAARRRSAAAAAVDMAGSVGAALSGAPVAAAPLPPLAAGARTGYGGRYARMHTTSQ